MVEASSLLPRSPIVIRPVSFKLGQLGKSNDSEGFGMILRIKLGELGKATRLRDWEMTLVKYGRNKPLRDLETRHGVSRTIRPYTASLDSWGR